MKTSLKIFLFILSLAGPLSQSTPSFAAPCCGKNAAGAPSFILGEDKAQVTLGYSYADTVLQPQKGRMIPLPPDEAEFNQTMRLQPTFLLSDRLQANIGSSWVIRTQTEGNQIERASRIGDLSLALGYEILPQWEYSRWKPQGFVFSSLSIPTGASRYEIGDKIQSSLQITGSGFYSLSLGSLFLKNGRSWDVFSISEIHYGLPRSFTTTGYRVFPGWGGSLGIGGGWNFQTLPLRLGGRLTAFYDEKPRGYVPPDKMDLLGSRFSYLSTWEVGLDLGYMLNSHQSIQVSYADQTLIRGQGSNQNRSFSLNFQQKWER